MKISFLVVATAVVSMAAALPLQAQHLHQHGNHFDEHQNVPHLHDPAGHMIDGSGHHINGDGRHTGWTGVYENGSYNSPWNSYYPSYPTYPSYATPTYVPSYTPAPNVASPAPYTTNRIPIPAVPSGGKFVLTNPRDSGGPIQYWLNEYTYTIGPGESQTVAIDRDWVIKFDNGLNRIVSYRLQDGSYEFTVSPQTGWDVARRVAAAPAVPGVARAAVAPRLSGNAIPGSLGSAPPPNTLGLPQ
ncbi:MAG: hypothetical protein ACTHK7_02555 [Aureliella sp.]